MSKLKHWAVHIFLGLIMEKSKDGIWTVSLGRISWWIAFLIAAVVWYQGKDIPVNHTNVLYLLAAYNLGKKVNDAVKSIAGPKTNIQSQVQISESPLSPTSEK